MDLYIEASDVEGCWPIIVPHVEVDRGIFNGHGDPTDSNYNKFYSFYSWPPALTGNPHGK